MGERQRGIPELTPTRCPSFRRESESYDEAMDNVQQAYDRRSDGYIDLLGSVEAMHAADRALVDEWSRALVGPILDAGCGPGHWTDYIEKRSAGVRGLDLSPRFVDYARSTFPHIPFEVGDLTAIPEADGSMGGIFAWYSLIHLPPTKVPSALAEFARVLRPGGALLMGFFEGARTSPFDHAVTTAYWWPLEDLAELVRAAGFETLETNSRTEPGSRPHADISGIRRP